jgi:PIN domain nuclease of toxin-antitoxin system
MNYLLDTHVFVWLDSSSVQLSSSAVLVLQTPGNQFYLSFVSLWEMQIKVQLGKLNLRMPVHAIVKEQVARNPITLLPITDNHIYELTNLPMHHKDPFDRLLIAQARVEQMTIITADPAFSNYPCTCLW